MTFSNDIKEMNLPDELSALEKFIILTRGAAISKANVIAIALAHAKRLHFPGERAGAIEWVKWAHEKFSFERTYIHHMRAVGDMLLDFDAQCFMNHGEKDSVSVNHCKILIKLEAQKLLPLTRLDRDKLGEILEAENLSTMTREEIRSLVRKELGESDKSPKKKKPSPYNPNDGMFQPDFFELMCQAAGDSSSDFMAKAQSARESIEAREAQILVNRSLVMIDTFADKAPQEQRQLLAQALREQAEKLEGMDK